MRHRKESKRLGRTSSERKALLQGLAKALLAKEGIVTTKVKAKEVQPLIDKIISIAKENTPESKRRVFALIRDKSLIETLFNDIAPRFKTRQSGYTRVIPTYPRRGDGAEMAVLELLEKKPKVTPKKAKAAPQARPEKKKEEPKKEEKPKIKEELKKEHITAPEPKADVKEEILREKAKEEQKKIKDKGFFKNLRRYFRGKAP